LLSFRDRAPSALTAELLEKKNLSLKILIALVSVHKNLNYLSKATES
jgi:hypothetical protein